MEALLPTLLGALPDLTFGGGALLLLVLSYRRNNEDRTTLTGEIARMSASHDAELVELKDDIAILRAREDEMQTRLDGALTRARQAEEATSYYQRQLPPASQPWSAPPASDPSELPRHGSRHSA